MASPSDTTLQKIQIAVFVAALAPLAWLFHGAIENTLGDDPLETLQRALGLSAFSFLLLTLTVTPLRRISGWHWLARLRRMFGLFAFFYASLHLFNWLLLDRGFEWHAIVTDVAKRPYIVAGFAAWLLMLPLAATSSNAMVKRLGGRRWQRLHRSVYPIAIVAAAHYLWQEMEKPALALTYAAVVALLLAARAWWRQMERQRQLQGAYGTPTPPMQKINIVKFHPRRK